LLNVGHEAAWIRIRIRIDFKSWIWIRTGIDFKSLIRIRIGTNTDPKH